jgi:hypothetical protein
MRGMVICICYALAQNLAGTGCVCAVFEARFHAGQVPPPLPYLAVVRSSLLRAAQLLNNDSIDLLL